MGKETLTDIIKDKVYKIVLPIYLWSINFESLEDYRQAIIENAICVGEITPEKLENHFSNFQ